MPRKPSPGFNEKELSKGQLRKLTALRKSLGEEIADKAFAQWFADAGASSDGGSDPNADIIAEELSKLALGGKLTILRGGYLVRRGRGRVIVERGAAAEE